MQPPTPTNPSDKTDSLSKKWYDKNGILIALLILFWPVGLYALWKRKMTSKGKKIFISVIVCGLFGFLTFAAIMANIEIKGKLAKAEEFWSQGQKAEAVALYKELLKTYSSSLEADDSYPNILVRVIETDVEHDNIAYARTLMEEALRKEIELPFQSEKVRQLYLQVLQSTTAGDEEVASVSEIVSEGSRDARSETVVESVEFRGGGLGYAEFKTMKDQYIKNLDDMSAMFHTSTGSMGKAFEEYDLNLLRNCLHTWNITKGIYEEKLRQNEAIAKRFNLEEVNNHSIYMKNIYDYLDSAMTDLSKALNTTNDRKKKRYSNRASDTILKTLVPEMDKYQPYLFKVIAAVTVKEMELKEAIK